MTVTPLLDQFLQGDLHRSLQIFLPELILCATIVALLLGRLTGLERKLPACWIASAGTTLALLAVIAQFTTLQSGGLGGSFSLVGTLFGFSPTGAGTAGPYFTGLMMHDTLSTLMRMGLLLFVALSVCMTVLTGFPDQEDGPDFYTLMLGAAVGMLMATGANHLLMMFLSIEMISIPSYALSGFLKGQKKASEAALKYVVYGAGTAGIMLYGISLLAGLLGTARFELFGERMTLALQGQPFSIENPVMVIGLLSVTMIFVGFAFKLSLAPFHFWGPDVFEGAAAEVGAYLSVGAKAAVFTLLARFLTSLMAPSEVVSQFGLYVGLGLAVIAAISMTLGNLTAYTQTNIKRLLAYSTISHAGTLLLAVAAMMVIANAPGSTGEPKINQAAESAIALEGLIYYLAVYLFMNLVAFTAVALLRNETWREDIDSYQGLISENGPTKVLCLALAVCFFSFVGLPPFAGFFAKFMIFRSTFVAGSIHPLLWGVLAIAALNTVLSLFYYARVLKTVFFMPRPAGAPALKTRAVPVCFLVLIATPILLLGASSLQGRLSETARSVATSLFPAEPPETSR